MKDPRQSIIPAGAITDSRLEGRDLQVLCLIGCQNENGGWCYASHKKLAETLHCGRATIQRSLERLIDAGWVKTKTTEVTFGNRRYASYAYRTVGDTIHPNAGPSDGEIEAQAKEMPPMGGHGAHGRAPFEPPMVPTGGHGAHTYVGSKESIDSKNRDDDDDSAGPDLSDDGCSPEAIALAKEIRLLAGGRWNGGGAIVQAFLKEGYSREHLIAGTREAMSRKRDGPPNHINYFRKPWVEARRTAETPVDVPKAEIPTSNGRRHDRRQETVDALNSLKEFARSDPDGAAQGSGPSGPSIGRIPLPKFG